MAINLLDIHTKITQLLIEQFGESVVGVDEEGYEYINDQYTYLYDSLYYKYLKENNIWISKYI